MPSGQTIPTIEERLVSLVHNLNDAETTPKLAGEDALAEIRRLLTIGNKARCRGCGAPIVWMKHANQKNVPYVAHGDKIGLNHFIDCPKAKEFKR